MTTARKDLVHPDQCRHYHLTRHCAHARRLCGVDGQTGADYSHRRQWVVHRITVAFQAFCIDLLAYCVLDTHYHLVIRLNPGVSEALSDDEVVRRWGLLYRIPRWIGRVRSGQGSLADRRAYAQWLTKRRRDLGNLSMLMKCINEPIARAANAEDDCKGSFWDARFDSKPLPTEKALLTCLGYVDLNKVRAGICDTPEASTETSFRQRARARQQLPAEASVPLMPFAPELASAGDLDNTIPCTLDAYLMLVDATGRVLRPDKRGAIPASARPIHERLGTNAEGWVQGVNAHHVKRRRFREAMARLQDLSGTLTTAIRHALITEHGWFGGYRSVDEVLGAG